MLQDGRHMCLQSARSAHGSVRQADQRPLKLLATLQEKENIVDVVYDGIQEDSGAEDK